MKNQTYGKYLLRKPLYSTQLLFNSDETKNLEIVVEDLLKDNGFIASIYWSSPELYDLILSFKNETLNKERGSKLIDTLKKYALRITTRATPYGTMAGVALKNIKNPEVENLSQMYRKARIDMDFLNDLKSSIERHPEIRKKLFYKINNTAFEIGDYYRYQEPIGREGDKKFQLTSLEKNEHLTKLYEIAELTAYDEIYSLFIEKFDSEEISSFLEELMTSKFLVNELQFKVTSDNTKDLLKTLKRLDQENVSQAKTYLHIFAEIEESIKIIESTNVSYLPLDKIEIIQSLAKSLGINNKHLFHVDLIHTAESFFELNERILKNINSSLSILYHFKNDHSVHNELEQFKRVFRIKYDSEEVQLTELLDDEFGIGFPASPEIGNLSANSLIEGIADKREKVTENAGQSNIDFLLDLIEKNQEAVIKLHEADLSVFNPASFTGENYCVIGVPSKESFFIQNISNPNPNSILGRFGLLDEQIKNLCEEILNQEEMNNPDVLVAEIIYIPQKRDANIVRRPRLTKYEITISGDNSSDARQILLNDLYVSINGEEIILRSKKLNKRVIPRLSNAHNFKRSENSAYNFLCSLQFQNEININLNFNYKKLKKRFVPRIVFKNIILHRSTWILHENDINAIHESKNSLSALKDFIGKWNVAKFVVMVKGDNELFIDTQNDSYLKLLLSEIKDSKIVQLSEAVHINEKSNFAEQVVIPLHHKAQKKERDNIRTETRLKRSFLPGSEWIYLKIYCNSNFSDELLANEIKPLLDELLLHKVIKSAFFIRYTDPHYHIRLRINLHHQQSFSDVLMRIHEVLDYYFQKKMVWNIQLDTYHRELSRYNPEFIEDTEKAFFADSMLILNLLCDENFTGNDDIKLFAAVKNVDSWLSLFALSLQEKMEFCKNMENAFLREFSLEFRTHLKTKFRALNNETHYFLKNNAFELVFSERDSILSRLNLCKDNLSSYIHMSINRWFNSEQRALELMTYTFATRHYNRLLNQKII
ncbi:lantibiotic dehydratase [uncultured Chryseobacterium sp.]|uniref:lantibiotic dehydratase n=1 Tax=uncultured Chryseobacterium sp. TaxID=259322 RepID=UPI0025FC4C74|nr:lantibiotic dehydratase [uncultured Chryseobacterium sp.]